MKRFMKCLLVCMLTLIMLSSSANASSLFDLLPVEPTPSIAPQSSIAPSYGDFAGVMADEETEGRDGGTIVLYQNVRAQQMEEFGESLQKQGYQVLEQEMQGNTTAYKLSNSTFTFALFYDRADQSLRAVYPKGTAYAQSAFPGYTKVKLGETFAIKGLGNFTFNSIENMEKLSYYYRWEHGGRHIEADGSSYEPGMLIQFSYYNTDVSAHFFYNRYPSNDGYNSLFQPKFCFMNIDNTYRYTSEYFGGFFEGKLHLDISGGSIDSLTEKSLAVFFELPAGAINSTDGTLGMTMDFPNGEKYVLMLRENGINLY